MSTRCHILFTDGDASLLTYKHSDGYPEGAIPLLREFWQWYPRTNRLEYLTATWFYFCKRQSEERIKGVDWNDWCDDPMKTNELNTNHPVALSYGICADEEIHGDTEHFYQVDIEDERVTHYTPEGIWFEDVDSPAEIVGREPEATYSLNLEDYGRIFPQQFSHRCGITDGGRTADLSHQEGCVECDSMVGTNWVVQAGTPVGRYLGLSDGETTEVCDACMREVAESICDKDRNARNESTKGGEDER